MYKTENLLFAMRMWSIENNLEEEFTQEILLHPKLNIWIMNDVLVKRFGYFVLEHSGFLD